MIPTDYHMHSTFSHDGHGTLDEMCRAALARGLSEICLTEHIDFDPEDENHGHFQYGDYAAAMAETRGGW
jgi:histidinol-phosphatase (PHP family)